MLRESPPFPNLIFLKLGGSLITDKDKPNSPQLEVITRLAAELSSYIRSNHKAQIILGHGSGSFGHVPAKEFGTRSGVYDEQGWVGFLEVWQAAAKLNHIVIDCLRSAGLPALAIPPSAVVTAANKEVDRWDLMPVISALKAGLLPVVYGDVTFDEALGGTILSTEDLFYHLALPVSAEAHLTGWIRTRSVGRLSPTHSNRQ